MWYHCGYQSVWNISGEAEREGHEATWKQITKDLELQAGESELAWKQGRTTRGLCDEE